MNIEVNEVVLLLLSGTNIAAIVGYLVERRKRKLDLSQKELEIEQLQQKGLMETANFYQSKFKDETEYSEELKNKLSQLESELRKTRTYIRQNDKDAKI